MSDTFILVTPLHLFKFKEYMARRYAELGVEDARNIVGRIGNLWFRGSRIAQTLNDSERYRRDACQNLADSGIKGRPYRPEDRPGLLADKKRSARQRDDYHYKANLFIDVNTLFETLPSLYITESELLEARNERVEQMFKVYHRRKRTAHLKRKHLARTKHKGRL